MDSYHPDPIEIRGKNWVILRYKCWNCKTDHYIIPDERRMIRFIFDHSYRANERLILWCGSGSKPVVENRVEKDAPIITIIRMVRQADISKNVVKRRGETIFTKGIEILSSTSRALNNIEEEHGKKREHLTVSLENAMNELIAKEEERDRHHKEWMEKLKLEYDEVMAKLRTV